jgi:integrase
MPRAPKQPAPTKRRPRDTGSVGQRRSDGRFFAILPPDLDPKRRPVYGWGKGRPFTDRDDAAAWLAAEVARLRDPTPGGATRREPLGAYLARWHRTYGPGWPVRTRKAYRAAILHWAPIGDVPLGELTHEHVQIGLAAIQRATWSYTRKDGSRAGPARPYSRRTILQARSVLHQALDQLVPHILARNPVKRSRLARGQEPPQPVWDAAEADRFLEAADREAPHLALAFRLILKLALRRGEVLALTWADLDTRRHVLTIDETAGDRAGEAGETKGRRLREQPLVRELEARLEAHRRRQHPPSRWIFSHDGRAYSARRLDDLARRLCDRAGVPRIAPKDMRATAATIYLDQGISLARVSRLLGHASTAVTAQHYDRVLRQQEARVAHLAEELEAAFRRATDEARPPTPIRPDLADEG